MNAAPSQPQTVRTPLGEFAVLPSRVIFDEHDEHDPQGNLIRSFGRAQLEEIARACNERDRKGAWCPLTLGHMVRDQYDRDGRLLRPAREDEQPDTVGYARNFQVAQGPQGKWVITADYYLRPDRYQEALSYPRTSVELWPQRVFDPIALLRRTPRLDIPQWTYARSAYYPERGSPVLRYQREDYAMPVPPGPMNAMPAPGGAPPPGAGGAPGDPDMGAKLESYMKHCASHQYAREIMDHYGGPGGGGAPPAPGAPPLGAEPPMDKPPTPFSRDAEIAALQAQLASLQRENRVTLRRQDLTALAEVVELDVEEELAQLADMEPARYQRELTRIRNRYAPKVDFSAGTRDGMVPTLSNGEEIHDHPTPYSRRPGSVSRFVENGTLTREGTREIQKFIAEHPELTTYERAREEFIKAHSNGKGR